MKTTCLRIAPLFLVLSLSLAGCKKPAPPAEQPAPAAQAAPEAAPAAPVTPAPASAAPVSDEDATAALEKTAAAAPPFDVSTVPETTSTIPPFPYVDYPPKVNEGGRWTTALPMDEVYVILGDKVRRLEGRITQRTFSHRDAEMSELEVRRNYQNALQAFGAVKVPSAALEVPTAFRMYKLRQPEHTMSYDVYLARKGAARHWIVVMTNSDTTRLISIEEKPFVQTIGFEGAPGNVQVVTATGVPAAAAQPLDIAALPVRTAPLPPFPYLAYPANLNPAHYFTDKANFDATGFIVGNRLRTVEGKVEIRHFHNRDADISQMAAQRNYEAAMTTLGAVKVNTTGAKDPALAAANGEQHGLHKKLRVPYADMAYSSYLLRTPDKNIWMALMFSDDKTGFVVVEEKAMQQSVALVTADTMRTELTAKGHIALYVNFDTDKATLRPDGKPAIDEIATLLKNDPALKLSIEGHTDNSGDAKHNLDLSRQRADAVVRTLVAGGIAAARLQAAGRGAEKPLADNKEEAGRAKNRRVELVKI